MKRKKVWLVVFLCLGLLAATWAFLSGDPGLPEELACHVGAYELDDGRLLTLTASVGKSLRYRLLSGRSGRLELQDDGRWIAGPNWSGTDPVVTTMRLGTCESGDVSFAHQTEVAVAGHRLEFERHPVSFLSHGTELRGEWVLPPGPGPFPTAILVHGSENTAATVFYDERFLYPALGVAALIYDKRGTGTSGGKYSQDFHLLSDDAVAARKWLQAQNDSRIGLVGFAGFSQGGWVAPFAATKTNVDFVIAAFGLAEGPLAEDRDEVLLGLRQAGFDEPELTKARQLTALTGRVISSNFKEGWSELREFMKSHKGESWLEHVDGEFTGDIMNAPPWIARFVGPLLSSGTSFDYDPMPVLRSIDVPHLWVLGGRDTSTPPERTIELLTELKQQKPNLELVIYPEADHGILVFEEKDGERVYTGYADGYLELLPGWMLQQQAKGQAR